MACAIRTIQSLIIEYREVEGKSKTDRVCLRPFSDSNIGGGVCLDLLSKGLGPGLLCNLFFGHLLASCLGMFTGVTNKRHKVVDYMKSGDRTSTDDNATQNCAAVKHASATTVQFLPHSSINAIYFSLAYCSQCPFPRPPAQDNCKQIKNVPALTARHSTLLSPACFPPFDIGA